MKLLQLYYFKALAEREHLTATAAELYISPPSLSAAISRLETDLGVPLFDRVGRNIRLNDKGRQFYDHVKLALDELDKGFDELQSTAAWNRNLSLRVATSTHIIWEKPFADYICKHPHVAFSHRSLWISCSTARRPAPMILSSPTLPTCPLRSMTPAC